MIAALVQTLKDISTALLAIVTNVPLAVTALTTLNTFLQS